MIRRWQGRVLGIAVVVAALTWIGVAGFAVHSNMRFTAVRKPALESDPRLFLPEGWKFFTKNPQTMRVLTFAQDDAEGGWTLQTSRNAAMTNLFGVVRKSGGQGVELAHALKSLPTGSWQKCTDKESDADCLDRIPLKLSFGNSHPNPQLCGSIGLIARKPVPWSWARLERMTKMPTAAVRLQVKC